MPDIQKICVILGAGASHDVRNENSPLIEDKFQPPLTNALFNFTNLDGREGYWDIVEGYAGAEALGTRIGGRVARHEASMEEQLTEYAQRHDPLIDQQLKHIPPYLRDLLYQCSSRYVETPGTYLDLVYILLSDHPHQILFLILNYDNLLEQALTGRDSSMTFTSIDSYVDPERVALVVKLHGSINWYSQLSNRDGADSSRWDNLVRKMDLNRRPADRDLLIVDDIPNVRRHHRMLYPVMTAPLARKDPASFTCPPTHIGAAREFLQDCRKFLVAGTSGLDKDLLDLLKENVQPRSHIQFIGKGQDADKGFRNYKNHIPEFGRTRVSVENQSISGGLASYVSSPEFQSFAGLEV